MSNALTLPEAIHGDVLGLVLAHPDDDIIESNLTYALRTEYPAYTIVILALTRGRNGLNFRTDDPTYVTDGKREAEGRAGAAIAGIHDYTQLDYDDGGVQASQEVVNDIVDWAQQKNVTTFVVARTGDHPDHDAVVDATELAAPTLGHTVHVLEVLPLSEDPNEHIEDREEIVVVDATPASIAQALDTAQANRSQFSVTTVKEQAQQDWIQIGEHYVSPHTHDGLFSYPIAKAAVYRLLRFIV